MKIRLYLIILLVCFSLLCVVFMNKEGFKSDYSDYNSIDRIMNSSNEYAYCVAGNVTCNDGTLNKIEDDYTGGKTYNFLCSDNTYAECKGNFLHNKDYLNWITPTARQVNFSFSDRYKGFTEPYDYIPIDISGNYINFYDSNKTVLDNIHKCEMLGTQQETDECYKQTNTYGTPGAPGTPGTPGTPGSPGSTGSTPSQCIANYGTNVGDPLCCGQKGILQYFASKYVCPSSAPTCSNYVCGKSYGTCS